MLPEFAELLVFGMLNQMQDREACESILSKCLSSTTDCMLEASSKLKSGDVIEMH